MKKNILIPFFFILNFLFILQNTGHSTEPEVKKSKLTVDEIAICMGITDRTPVGKNDIFPSEIEKLYCFTRITGAQEETKIIHTWYYNEKITSRIYLKVKSDNWRTFSTNKIRGYKGEWRVEIRSNNKELLKTVYFIIE